MNRPGNDEERPYTDRPHVHADPTPSKRPALSKDDTPDAADTRWRHGVAQHLVLPAEMTEQWATSVVLSPPGRPVVVDGMDCEVWSAEAVHALAWRLGGRRVDVEMAAPALAFWLTSDVAAVQRWVA